MSGNRLHQAIVARSVWLAAALLSLGVPASPFADASRPVAIAATGAAASPSVPWSALKFGTNGVVNAFAVDGTNLYVGGSFSRICGNAACSNGVAANSIAKWNGTAWSALGLGLQSSIYAIVVRAGQVYAGGSFYGACGNATCDQGAIRVNNIARFNGTKWVRLGHGLAGWNGGSVEALLSTSDGVIAGGTFDSACADDLCNSATINGLNHVALWNGTAWSGYGWGVGSSGQTGGVSAMALYGGRLVVGGYFTGACETGGCSIANDANRTNNVAEWTGTTWQRLGHGVMGQVLALKSGSTGLVAGGVIGFICGDQACSSGNTKANNVVSLSGTQWHNVGNGLATGQSSGVEALTTIGTTLYAGGNFTRVCPSIACPSTGSMVNHIARWNGSTWGPIAHGFDGDVRALANVVGKLYAGGTFHEACGSSSCTVNDVEMDSVARLGPGTSCTSVPAAPLLYAPATGSNAGSTSPTLYWHVADCASSYTLTVKTAQGAVVQSKAGLTVLQYTTQPLAAHRSFKWNVKACNLHGCTGSQTWAFTTP